MGRKRGVERGALEIFLHLLRGQDEIINESTQNHQPPLLIKNERSPIHRAFFKDFSVGGEGHFLKRDLSVR
jgi:hypothetical protein